MRVICNFLLLFFWVLFLFSFFSNFAVPVLVVHIQAGLPCSFGTDGYLGSCTGRLLLMRITPTWCCCWMPSLLNWMLFLLTWKLSSPYGSGPLTRRMMIAECVPVLVWSEFPRPSEERGRGNEYEQVYVVLLGVPCARPPERWRWKQSAVLRIWSVLDPHFCPPLST